MPASPLTARERVEIRIGIERNESNVEIGFRLSRHRTTIGDEINRNGGRLMYCAVAAGRRSVVQRQRPKTFKLVADSALAAHVAKRLEQRDSPMTISIELARGIHGRTASISHECIYQAVHNGERGLPAGCHRRLHLGRRHRKHRGQTTPGSHSLGEFNLIHTRPAIADERREVGHLEGDLITGSYNRSALITVFDRASRKVWLADLPDGKRSNDVRVALTKLIRRIPKRLRRTLTWDQGSEMAEHIKIAKRCGIDIYFAEPKSPWQRPTNENGNAFVRRYVGKGTDLSIWTPPQLRKIEQRINTTPRRSLDWATANDIYTAAVTITD